MKPPRPGAQVLVIETFSGRVRSGRVDPDHIVFGGPCTHITGLWHPLLPHGEGLLWARGWGRKTRAALEAAYRLASAT